jgi:hypothetical protein
MTGQRWIAARLRAASRLPRFKALNGAAVYSAWCSDVKRAGTFRPAECNDVKRAGSVRSAERDDVRRAGILQLQGFHVLDQIVLLLLRQIQSEHINVMVDDIRDRRRAPVMEVRRVLPECAQRCRPVQTGGAPLRPHGIHARGSWIMQAATRERQFHVTRAALRFAGEDQTSPLRGGRVEEPGGQSRCFQRKLIVTERREFLLA